LFASVSISKPSADNDMTRWLLKAVDVGASAVFVALCAKAFCILFVEDIKQQSRVPKPLLSAVDAIKRAAILLVQSASGHRRPPSSY
jgi:hypothetical protein